MARSSAVTVKIPTQTHIKLLQLAHEDDVSMGEIITDLVNRYETERFWQGVKEDYDRLKRDPVAWQEYIDEVKEIDAAGFDDPDGLLFGDEE
ncbi:MAG: hypothetical protein KC435_10140 [Thermomicrobiales bacterium]|nr:hypothetical protein [Thermomicrobiales bacterium]